MSMYPAEILFVVFVAFVILSLIIVESVKLFLGIWDSRKVTPHTLQRIH